MTPNSLSQCCATGSLREGEAKGEMKDIGASMTTPANPSPVSTYFGYPADKSTDNAILILTDVIGHQFINAQVIADQFAAAGYFVVMPDLFKGDVVRLSRPEGFNVMDWVKNHLPQHTAPIIDEVLKEMRENLGCKRIGVGGYCFGGKYVCRHLKAGKLDAGFTAHPTMVEADELRGIEEPLSIAAAGESPLPNRARDATLTIPVRDVVFTTAKRHESEEILDKLDVTYQINMFSDVEHSFSVRCDLSKPRQKFAKEQAFVQAVSRFNEYVR
ncbi:Uncharacterized protein TCAP_00010 [Tolypocladium capitatum]|uniref:Dienelactone hydrolase domain-containing protein n=1 Tax=Tolypocladium capitatum TaxID=45235 RepID=A0A2K3QRB0_9HYPO|nr:Uncharacterized protein TCAP_00010 [Tolypocladium capitatum]